MKSQKNNNILHFKAIFVIIVLVLTSSSALVAAENGTDIITKTYSFERPQIKQIEIDGNIYDQIISNRYS